MDAGNAARERPDHNLHPPVAYAHVVPRSAESLPNPTVGTDAPAPLANTSPPAVTSSSEGEAPAAPVNIVIAAAPHAQTTGAPAIGGARVDTSEVPATMALMRVKENLAIVKMGGGSEGREMDVSCDEVIADHVYEEFEEVFGDGMGVRENIDEGSSLTDGTYRLKQDQKAGLGSQDGPGPGKEFPGHGPGLYGVGRVGGSGGTGGRFALLADEDVDEGARPLVGGGNKGRDWKKRGGLDDAVCAEDLPDFSEAEGDPDDEYWVGKGSETVEDKIWNSLCNDVNQTPANLNIKETETMFGYDTQQAGMEEVHYMRLKAHQESLGRPIREEVWTVIKGRKVRKKIKFSHKVANESGGVVKGKTERRNEARKKGPLSVKQVLLHDDAADKLGLMVEPVNKVHKGAREKSVSNPKTLGIPSDDSANKTKTGGAVDMSIVETLSHEVEAVESTEKVEGQDNDVLVMKDVESNPKPHDTRKEVHGNKAKIGGLFTDEKGKRKEIGEEKSAHYTEVANDSELVERKFCETYEHLLASIKCTMSKCSEPGCVLKNFNKGHDYRAATTSRNRGSVKGTRCGKSSTFATCMQQWFALGILDDVSRQAKTRQTTSNPEVPEMSEEASVRSDQQGRNDRAIALIAENIKKSMYQAEALAKQAEAQRLFFLAEIQKIKENASRIKATLNEAVRRRDAGENFDVDDVDIMAKVQAPPTHTAAHHPAPTTEATDPLGMVWTSIAASAMPLTKTQRADLASEEEKVSFRTSYAMKVRERSQLMDVRKRPSPRRRTTKGDAEKLAAVGVKNMAHEEASKIRADLRMALRDGVRVIHVRYLQENQTELLTPRHQEQALKDQLAELGYIVKSIHSALTMQVRRVNDGEKRERRNAYCAARAIERTLKENLGKSVKAYYEKLLDEVKDKLPEVFTDKGQDEFNLEYGVHVNKVAHNTANKPADTSLITKERDNSVPASK